MLMRNSTQLLLILAASTAFACSGKSTESGEPSAAESAAVEAPEEAESPEPGVEAAEPPVHFEVHEWGLIDVLDSGVEVAAGPGNGSGLLAAETSDSAPTSADPAGAGSSTTGSVGTASGTAPAVMDPVPIMPPGAGRRKPVLYIHSQGDFHLTATVELAGEVAEVWPQVGLRRSEASTISWDVDVLAPGGSCDSGPYPSVTDEACVDAPDGYCELAELETYETSDGACLRIGEEHFDHLFYRGRNGDFETGLSVAEVEGAVAITNDNIQAPTGRLFILDRRNGIRASAVDFPAAGQTATVPTSGISAEGVDVVQSGISELLRSEGLTDEEAQAFERAWFDEFFGSGETGGAPQVPFSVLYFIPSEQHNSISELSFEPAAESVSRVFMARIAIK